MSARRPAAQYARNTQPVHPQRPVHLQQNTRNSPQEELEEAAFAEFRFRNSDPSGPSMAARSDWHENLHRASQTAPCCAPMLGSVPIHQSHPMQAIATLRFRQSREIDLQLFLEELGHLYYLDPLTTNQLILI